MFREVKIDDKDDFISMVKDFYNSEAVLHTISTENILNTYKEVVSNSPYAKAYIIEAQGKTAGYGLISLTYSNEVGGLVVWIEEVYVLEDYRGLGLGDKFLDFIKSAFSSNAKRFRLELTKSNISAKNLYKKKGYKSLDYMQMVLDTSGDINIY